MKLMDIYNDHLGIHVAEFQAIVRMPLAEFARICKDLSTIDDTVVISVSKEGVKFSTRSDIGTANIVCKQNTTVDKPEEASHINGGASHIDICSKGYELIHKDNPFGKASDNQRSSLSSDLPGVVEYKVAEMSYIRFYLAPKLEEDQVRRR
ncbi:hypothetical protein CIPAW_15G124600 [Carya illinoinensis]|uniref:Proliferating cell nuclear antigen PCNA C-terminal domain-containing protein n=1 Tax=Carya illinoinensis TaxID=32201 RepID=A0A8T1NEU8_CARIL|nr:hypothetical protein CIPAW_15G124600 [Carya illinoinensis]